MRDRKTVKSRRSNIPRRRDSNATYMLRVNGGGRRASARTGLPWGTMISVGVALAGLLILLIMAVFAGDRLERLLLSQCDQFLIRQIDLKTDGRFTLAHLKEYARVEEGANLFAVDIARIQTNLETLPVVRTASVSRRLPDTLVIRLSERTPVACLRMGDSSLFFGVDREGAVLPPNSVAGRLPILSGVRQPDVRPGIKLTNAAVTTALRLIESCNAPEAFAWVRVNEVYVGHPDYMQVLLVGGEIVHITQEDMEAKVLKLVRILQAAAQQNRRVQSIDMTVSRNFPAQMRP